MLSGDARQRLLGLGVLLLTMIPGYIALRVTGQYEIVSDAYENVTDADDSPSSTMRTDFYIRSDSDIRIESQIRDVATRYGISENLIAAIIEAESEFNPGAVSCRGARGLMQLMPSTAAILGVGNSFDLRENIEGGARHLRSLMDRFKNNLPLVLAAYNAGERAVIYHRGVPPYRETRRYVNRILRRLELDGAKTSFVAWTPHRAPFDDGRAFSRAGRCS